MKLFCCSHSVSSVSFLSSSGPGLKATTLLSKPPQFELDSSFICFYVLFVLGYRCRYFNPLKDKDLAMLSVSVLFPTSIKMYILITLLLLASCYCSKLPEWVELDCSPGHQYLFSDQLLSVSDASDACNLYGGLGAIKMALM